MHSKPYAIPITPRVITVVERWLDGEIGIQELIDLTDCTRSSAYSIIARTCRHTRARD